jgi:Tfp pilus assembly protein PilV
MVGVVVMSVMVVSLYMAFTQGFAVVQIARENLRGTQILQEKMETMRLYSWDQINSNGFIPATFQANFYDTTSGTNCGVVYNGTTSINPSPMTNNEAYAANHRLIVISVNWTSAGLQRTRTMTSLVSSNGLHNYIWAQKN